MDETDRRLVALLQTNARAGISTMAAALNLSRATVRDRLLRLEDSGVIAGYTVRLGDDVEQRLVRAVAMIKIEPKAQDGVVAALRKEPAVIALYTIAGEYDLLCILRDETTGLLDGMLDRIAQIKGVERTSSSVILSTKIEK